MKPSNRTPQNPFPGLRPFREDEEHLFFGRESQVDRMVDKLASTRFLAVVGTSGSGKSSLVNCGLCPALHRGLMARAGTRWRVAQFRPGMHPIRNMAKALARKDLLFKDFEPSGLSLAEVVETTLDMSKLGLLDIYEQARVDHDVNLLVVVDQFEELFRFSQVGNTEASGVSEEAIAFVNLLLEARAHPEYPIYVALSMRSDFLGDCAQFPGLPEALNEGQYLVPRLTRDERRAAISGPIGVGGGKIAPVLLTRLVNDVGDNPDQLSILQHALNRTWARWQHVGDLDRPLDLEDYEAIGTMAEALDRHAEKAFAELAGTDEKRVCEKLFKALTDKASDSRGIRRPTQFGTLCALADADADQVTRVIDVFRKPSRSFLMPPAGEDLAAETVIDISHETLMRVWRRLGGWADEEAHSAQMYRRLADTAKLHAREEAGLYRDPNLQLALEWRKKNQPNGAWAKRYDPEFDLAMNFLSASRQEQVRSRKIRRSFTLWPLLAALAAALTWFVDRSEEFEEAQAAAKRERTVTTQLAREIELLAALYRLGSPSSEPRRQISESELMAFNAEIEELGRSEVADIVRLKIADKLMEGEEFAERSPELYLIKMDTALSELKLEEAAQNYGELREIDTEGSHRESARNAWRNYAKIKLERQRQLEEGRELIKKILATAETSGKGAVDPLQFPNDLEALSRLGIAYRLLGNDLRDGECARCVELNQIDAHLESSHIGQALEHLKLACPNQRQWHGHCRAATLSVRYEWEAVESRLLRDLYNHESAKRLAEETGMLEGHLKPFYVPGSVSEDQGGTQGAALDQWLAERRKQFELNPTAGIELLHPAGHGFLHPLHFRLARKLADGDAGEPLSHSDKSLLALYAHSGGDNSLGMEYLSTLDEAERYTSYMLLGRSVSAKALGQVEQALPPVKKALQDAESFLTDFWGLIAIVMLYPVWLGFQLYRKRFRKGYEYKARPSAIRRLLAAAVDFYVALGLGLFLAYIAAFMAGIAFVVLSEESYSGEPAERVAVAVFLLTFLVTSSAYFLFRDNLRYRNHRSVGKIMFMLVPAVGKDDLRALNWFSSLKRNLLVTVVMTTLFASMVALIWWETFGASVTGVSDETLVGVLGLTFSVFCGYVFLEFLLATRKASKTLGDRLANTRVIDVRSEDAKAIHGSW